MTKAKKRDQARARGLKVLLAGRVLTLRLGKLADVVRPVRL
jgi:hypothetical protein